VPEPEGASDLVQVADRVAAEIDGHIKAFSTQRALVSLWELVSATNRYLDSQAPWKLAKDPEARGQLATVMYECLEALRVIASLLSAFLPETSARILESLGHPDRGELLPERLRWGGLQPGASTVKGEQLFPRIELE
jgi:methionyl-tRNA synthetase